MQIFPNILPASRRAQTSHTQPRIEARGDLVEAIQFIEAIARQYTVHRQAMVLCRKQFQAAQRTLEDAFPPYSIVRLLCPTLQAYLEIESVKLLGATDPLRSY